MSSINIYLSDFLFTSSLITLLIAVYSGNHKHVPAARAFTGLCLASTIYSFGYGMELIYHDLSITLRWNLLQYFGIEFIPIFWFLIAVQYCGIEKLLTRWVKILLFTIPLVMIIIRFTNPMHHLFYKNEYIVSNGLFQVMYLEKGPLYLFSAFITISSVLCSNFLYLKRFFQSKGKFKYQSVIMCIASIMPLLSYFILIFNISPFDIDFTPFFSTISYLLLLVGLFKFQFLNIVPFAHEKVFNSIKDVVIVLNDRYQILDFNKAAAEIFEDLNKQAIGKHIDAVLGTYKELIRLVMDGKEMQFKKSEGNANKFYMVNRSPIKGKLKNTIGFIISLNDITKQIDDMNKLKLMATMDSLTEIYNRSAFIEACERELSKAKKFNTPVSLIMLDLDHFKKINDKFGHQAGDALLKHIANVCKSSVRSVDILGRFGGEEFMIFLPKTTIAETVVIGERIRRNIEKLIVIFDGNRMKITASIGISGISEAAAESIDLLIKCADEALYLAKEHGRNCVKLVPISAEK